MEQHCGGDKQPCDKEAAKLKETYEKGSAAYRAKGKPMWPKEGVAKAERGRRRRMQ